MSFLRLEVSVNDHSAFSLLLQWCLRLRVFWVTVPYLSTALGQTGIVSRDHFGDTKRVGR